MGTVVKSGEGADVMDAGACVPVIEGVAEAVGAGVTGPGVELHPAAPRKHAATRKRTIRYARLFI